MAFNLENMTVSYRSLLKLVPTQRTQLAQSGAINDLISVLTPGQLVNLFPRYYRDQLPDVGQVNNYSQRLDVALSGGSKLTSSSAGGMTTYGNVPSGGNRKALTPEEKAIQEIFQKAFPNQVGSEATSGMIDDKGRVISTAATNMTPQERALLDTIAHGESPDYNTIAGGTKFESFADHPRAFGELGTTAAGRYQFVKGTWDGIVSEYNKRYPDNPITDFSPENQDRAALYLAQRDYKQRTGRDLKADLDSPPENFGELVRYGLGGFAKNTTWQAFQKMTNEEIQNIFESNYQRNIGYVKEIEAAADKIKDFETAAAKFDPSMLSQLDQRLQNWYNTASDIQKKKFETAIEKLGTDQFNEVMKRQPVNSPTLDAVSTLPEGSPLMNPVGGSMSGTSITSEEAVPFSGGSYGSRSFGGPRGTNQLHTGVDIPGKPGDPVLAVDTGTILDMRKSPSGYGYTIDIQYPDGTIHRMAHLGTNEGGEEGAFAEGLKIGDTVSAGQRIGTLGYSGNAGAEFPHVHYEVMKQDYYEQYKGRPPGRISGRTDESMQELEDGRIDPREWYARRQEEYAKKIQQDAEAKAQASPGTATAAAIEPNTLPAPPLPTQQPVAVEPNKLPTPPVLANGGNIEVPTGEDIVGLNTKTGEAEFFANSRENIRVEPGTLENKQQMPVVTQEDMKSLETPTQAINTRQQPVYRENLDPDLYYSTSGDHYIPPSQLRATNRAKLHGDDSTGLVNNHFA